MNVPNKITLCRIGLSILLLILMIFPVDKIGLSFPMFEIVASKGTILIDCKYIICGIMFAVAAFTDFLDGCLARKYNLVTDFGKILDAIADKVLVNGVLILFAVNGYISPVIPVVIISRDTIVDSIKMIAGQKAGAVGASKLGKIKTVVMLVGLTLTFFYNLPFELWNINVASVFLLIATVLSVVSGVEYYEKNKKYFFDAK